MLSQPIDPFTAKPLTYVPNATGGYELRAEKSEKSPLIFKVNPANRMR